MVLHRSANHISNKDKKCNMEAENQEFSDSTYKEITLVLHVTKESTNHCSHMDHMSWLEFFK